MIFLSSLGTTIGLFFGVSLNQLILTYSILEQSTIGIVFILESISILLAAREGIYLGISLFFPQKIFEKNIPRKKAFIKTLKQTVKVFLIVAVLLIIASIIESVTIFSLTEKGITFV